MKKAFIFLILIIIIVGVVIFKKNQTQAPVVSDNNQVVLNEMHCALSVVSPLPNTTVSFPLEVKVIVDNTNAPDCRWTVFEAQAGFISLSDVNGPIALVGSSALTTTDDWMTTSPVTYTTTLTPVSNPTGTVTITFNEEDVKGDGNAQTASYTVIAQ